MSSLIKIQSISTPKLEKSFRQHEPYQYQCQLHDSDPSQLTSAISSSRVPTAVEYKAIIHSAICPVEDMLRKAREILAAEAGRIVASTAPPIKTP